MVRKSRERLSIKKDGQGGDNTPPKLSEAAWWAAVAEIRAINLALLRKQLPAPTPAQMARVSAMGVPATSIVADDLQARASELARLTSS